jgi:hypothetical protein
MPLFVLNIIGWVVANWRLLVGVAGAVALLIVFGLVMRACEYKPKFDEAQIRKNQEAIASRDRELMEKAAEESRVVEAQIDANRADAENRKLKTLEDARREIRQMSNEQLAEYLENLK